MFRPLSTLRRQTVADASTKLPGRLPMLRYFIGVSLVVMLVVTAFVALFFVRAANRDFAQQSEARGVAEAEHIAHLFFLTVWTPVNASLPDLTFEEAVHPKMMDIFAVNSTFGLDVVGLNIWSADGALVWSSGSTGSEAPPASTAWYSSVLMDGAAVAAYEPTQLITDLSGEARALDVVRTVFPLRDVPPSAATGGNVLGAIEIIQDVSPAAAVARATTHRVAWAVSLGTAVIVLALLLAFGVRADRSSRRMHDSLMAHERELGETQAQQAQSAKLAAMGELVASVAHELNNPLTGIAGISQLLLRRDLEPRARAEAEMIHQEATRSTKIVENLLSYARARQSEKAYTSINAAVNAALELRHYHLMVNNIDVVTELQANLPRTMADPHKIQQVALNLLINAEQAMISSGVGSKITISTHVVGRDSIRFTVADDGPGIAQGLIDKVFDPFFTTKDESGGTGLGLSLCYAIVQEHGGTMRVMSTQGVGTEFTIHMPVVAATEGRGASAQSTTAEHQLVSSSALTG